MAKAVSCFINMLGCGEKFPERIYPQFFLRNFDTDEPIFQSLNNKNNLCGVFAGNHLIYLPAISMELSQLSCEVTAIYIHVKGSPVGPCVILTPGTLGCNHCTRNSIPGSSLTQCPNIINEV
jgi:hypothetical protein